MKILLVGLTSALTLVATLARSATAFQSIENIAPTLEIKWDASSWSDPNKQEPWQIISLTVPEQNISVKTGENGLRLNDSYVAKMYGVTHYLCTHEHKPDKLRWLVNRHVEGEKFGVLAALLTADRRNEGFDWFYEAGNGNFSVGRYKISCQAAQDIANQYGTKASPPTSIVQTEQQLRPSDGTPFEARVQKQYTIPELNLISKNIPQWQAYVERQSLIKVGLSQDVNGDSQVATLTVPDQDTTVPVNDERLRLYDAHLANMFAISHLLCQQGRIKKNLLWHYTAGDGQIAMGMFPISCRLAAEVASAYGLRNQESIGIVNAIERPYQPASVEGSIPTLNLTSTKAARWMDFTESFQPERSSWEIPKSSFLVEKVLPQLQGITEVPILLPTNGFGGGGFNVHVDKDGYSIGLYAGEGKCGSGCASGASWHGDISASRASPKTENNDEPEVFKINPRTQLRKIQLSHHTPAVFRSSCGAYCVSSVRWQYKGVNYTVDGKGGQHSLVKAANSMIEAGPR
jgi:hypothetical protein